ncbi:MAG: hypothetical protein Ct9H300mP13_0650 [Gammaproteobacteria bacterium]|nr:MAG: hypothetical protein Ct9H300mP13_0650 [Gammaproteobacteria bacterium]
MVAGLSPNPGSRDSVREPTGSPWSIYRRFSNCSSFSRPLVQLNFESYQTLYMRLSFNATPSLAVECQFRPPNNDALASYHCQPPVQRGEDSHTWPSKKHGKNPAPFTSAGIFGRYQDADVQATLSTLQRHLGNLDLEVYPGDTTASNIPGRRIEDSGNRFPTPLILVS